MASSTGNTMDLGLKQAMKTSDFWFFTIVMFICGGGDYFATIHLIPLGYRLWDSAYDSRQHAAGVVWAYESGWSSHSRPAADLMGSKVPIILTLILRVLLFVMLIQYKNEVSFYVFAFAFGFTHLITAPLTPILIGKLYGFTYLGILTGFINTAHFVGAGLALYGRGYF